MTPLLSLAARVEGLSAADREVDAEIARALGWKVLYDAADPSDRIPYYQPDPDISWRAVPLYSFSLDAATTLFPVGAIYRSGHSAIAPDPSMFFCDLTLADGRDFHALAHTEAAARVAAALKALAQIPDLKEGTCDE
jgi:hypothetical protein